jgi:16S rRNA G966 N2-methylase RsmD
VAYPKPSSLSKKLVTGNNTMSNKLFFSDDLKVRPESIPDNSVNLIYLDPPFNSKKL